MIKMDPKKEIEKFRQFQIDELDLEEMISNYRGHIIDIVNANTAKDIKKIEEELCGPFHAIDRYKNSSDKNLIYPKLKLARQLKRALNDRKKELDVVTYKPRPRDHTSPNLVNLMREYNILENETRFESRQHEDKQPKLKLVNLSELKEESATLVNNDEESDCALNKELCEYDIDPLSTLLRYYQSKDVVGEEKTSILQTLAAIKKMNFGIVSLSGSGKSHTIDKLIDLIGEDFVYTMQLSSKTAAMYDANEINKKKIIYIPELQKAMKKENTIVVEILKNITEGKNVERKVYDSKEKETKKYEIEAGKGVIFTLALENDFKYDAELSRRIFTLKTDISKDQTEKILKYKAEKRHAKKRNKSNITKKEETELRNHVINCLNLKIEDYENPYSDLIAKAIPKTIRARSYDKYYFDLIEANGKFNHQDRIIQDGILYLDLRDVYTIDILFSEQFSNGLLNIPILGEEILNTYQNKEEFSINEVYAELRSHDESIKKSIVTNAIEAMVENGFLQKNSSGKSSKFSLLEKPTNYMKLPDYQQMFDHGKEFMEREEPELANSWLENMLDTEGNLKVYNPIENKYFKIASSL